MSRYLSFLCAVVGAIGVSCTGTIVRESASSAENCGTGGHDGLGGTCEDGSCQPVELAGMLPKKR